MVCDAVGGVDPGEEDVGVQVGGLLGRDRAVELAGLDRVGDRGGVDHAEVAQDRDARVLGGVHADGGEVGRGEVAVDQLGALELRVVGLGLLDGGLGVGRDLLGQRGATRAPGRPSRARSASWWSTGPRGRRRPGAILESLAYSASVMPELVARIRSGASSATSSIGAPSASSYLTGASAPASSTAASNHSVEPASLPPHVILVAPTGHDAQREGVVVVGPAEGGHAGGLGLDGRLTEGVLDRDGEGVGVGGGRRRRLGGRVGGAGGPGAAAGEGGDQEGGRGRGGAARVRFIRTP